MPLSVFRKDGGVTKNEQLMGEKTFSHMVVILFAVCFYSTIHLLIPLTMFKDYGRHYMEKNQFKNSKLLIQKDMKKRTNDYMQCHTDHNKEKVSPTRQL